MADFTTPVLGPESVPRSLFPTYSDLDQQVADLKQQNEDLKQQIADLEQQIENLKQQNAKLGEDAALWKSLYDKESDENDKLRRENAVLEE